MKTMKLFTTKSSLILNYLFKSRRGASRQQFFPYRGFSTYLLYLLVMCIATMTNGQRPDRPDLNDLSFSDQLAFANCITMWLNENPHVVDHHYEYFNAGIHNTNNFLPGHRAHVRKMEAYMVTQPDCIQFSLLPKWYPENPLPTNLEALFGTAYDNSSITMNLPYTPLDPNTYPEIYLPQGYCGMTDAGSFSDDLETGYHADVHSLAGGEMNTPTSPRVPLFWTWHAWVDEIWYRWERDCAATYTVYDLSDNKITINGVVTWSSSQYVKGEIEIEDGAELIISGSNTTINMANSQYDARRTYIRVKPGGKLSINGATLTGMGRLGLNTNGDAPTGGVFYNEMWEGIVVEAQGGLRGTVTLSNNATIEHAAIGIRSISGGRIYAEDARFYNNRISVSIELHPYIPALTQFVGCEFKNDAPLRDAIYRYYLNDSSLEQERVSNLSGATQSHVQLLNSRGIVFNSCEFSNPYQEGEEEHAGDNPEAHKAIGISAKNSRLYATECTFKDLRHGMYFDNSQGLVEGCEFDYQFPNPHAVGINMYSSDVIVTANSRFYDLGWGIYAGNAQAGPAGILRVEQSMFYNNFQGIFLFGADYAQVKECSFYVPPMPSANEMSAGVVITGSAAFDVTQNEFYRLGTGEAYGIITDNTAEEYPNLIARNDFGAGNVPGPSYSIQVENDNSRLQMLCNDFNTYGQAQSSSIYYAIGLKNAILPDQGFFLQPTANRWDQQYSVHIKVDLAGTISPFNYYRYSNTDHAPTTNSTSVNIIDNFTFFDENTPNTCGANPCEGIAWPCELEKINGLEEEIGESSIWGLSPEETEQRIQELKTRQEQLAIDMVRNLVLADSGYLAAQRLEELLDVLPHLSSDQSILEQRYGTGGTMGLNQSNQSLGLELQVISRETVHYIVQQTFEERKNVRLFYQPVTSHQMINAKPAQDQPPTILYPNPVKLCAYLQVNLPPSEMPYRLQWKDIYGREIASGLLTATVNGEYQCVAPCDAPAGYYLIQIIDDGGIVDCLPIVLMN